MKDADDESVSVFGNQQKQMAGDCARYLQSVYLSGARTNLIFDWLVKMSDAANGASGLTIKMAAEATGAQRRRSASLHSRHRFLYRRSDRYAKGRKDVALPEL